MNRRDFPKILAGGALMAAASNAKASTIQEGEIEPFAVLSAFTPAGATLSVKGAVQIGSSTWGVFDGEPFEIVIRNPHEFLHHVELTRNMEKVVRTKLDHFEQRSFAVDTTVGEEARFSITFWSEEPPSLDELAANPSLADHIEVESDGLRVVSLGGNRQDVLTNDGIAKAGMMAARDLWHDYLSALGHENPLQGFAWHVESGSPVEQAASEMQTSLEEAEDWIASYKKIREEYLLGMMLEAKARVEAQLSILRAMSPALV